VDARHRQLRGAQPVRDRSWPRCAIDWGWHAVATPIMMGRILSEPRLQKRRLLVVMRLRVVARSYRLRRRRLAGRHV